jgi:hypothetical protein
MIDFEAELDRLAADLAVLDVACGAGTRVNWRLEALAAIRALDQVKLHAAWGAAIVPDTLGSIAGSRPYCTSMLCASLSFTSGLGSCLQEWAVS